MLNTQKLLYILPDLAYVAELLPAKKPNTFAIQNFRQINGEFLDDNEFLAENVLKLFSKLESDTYFLVLPDFLFTNTIVTVKETGDTKVKKYLKETLLPELSLTEDSHEVETFVLTELKGESKVQLSAIEKSVLSPVRVGASEAKVTVKAVLPLSWTLKSVISLEPSLSVLQIGGTLYSALHYIGVDQTNQAPVAEVEAIGETIKTLKGAEPSIQTIYLLANSLVEEKLKEQLSDTVPLQQLSSFKEEDAQMPSYVKEIIESGMKTLSIEEYPVPRFPLGKPTQEELNQYSGMMTKVSAQKTEPEATPEEDESEELPPPTPKPLLAAVKSPASLAAASASEPEINSLPEPELTPALESGAVSEKVVDTADNQADDQDVDLSKFAQLNTSSMSTTTSAMDTTPSTPKPLPSTPSATPPKEKVIIKNSSGIGPMLKMIFITLAVFIATVAIGVGVGLGLLQITNKDEAETTPVVITSPTPEPSPSPTPSASPAAALDKTALDILVVNATSKAGYAGTIKTKLTTDGFKNVTTGNAKGDYAEAATYVLLSDDNGELVSALEEATELELSSDAELEKDIEDPQDQYDVVIVLAE